MSDWKYKNDSRSQLHLISSKQTPKNSRDRFKHSLVREEWFPDFGLFVVGTVHSLSLPTVDLTRSMFLSGDQRVYPL